MGDTGAPWAWLDRYVDFTLTFTFGLAAEELLERYGTDPATAQLLPYKEAQVGMSPPPDVAILRVGRAGEWAFGIEDIGLRGAAPATLIRLSMETETVSVRRGGNAMTVLQRWVGGRPQEQFEPGEAATLRAAGPYPLWNAAERYRVENPGMRAIIAAMYAVEDHIGSRLDQETGDGPLASVLLPQTLPGLPSPVPPLPRVFPQVGRRSKGLGPPLGPLRRPADNSPDPGSEDAGQLKLPPTIGHQENPPE